MSGNSNVSNINYTYTPSYPTFTANASLPDSISLSAGVTINLPSSSVSSTSGLLVEIVEGSHYVYKSIPPSTTNCTFTASDLSTLNVSTSAIIIIVFSNGTFQTFGGKKYYFDSTLEHLKYNIKLKL